MSELPAPIQAVVFGAEIPRMDTDAGRRVSAAWQQASEELEQIRERLEAEIALLPEAVRDSLGDQINAAVKPLPTAVAGSGEFCKSMAQYTDRSTADTDKEVYTMYAFGAMTVYQLLLAGGWHPLRALQVLSEARAEHLARFAAFVAERAGAGAAAVAERAGLLIAQAGGFAALTAGVDAGVQLGQILGILNGHRDSMDWESVATAAVSGAGAALGGALGGHLAQAVVPHATPALLGRAAVAATAGISGVIGGAAAAAAMTGQFQLSLSALASGAAVGMASAHAQARAHPDMTAPTPTAAEKLGEVPGVDGVVRSDAPAAEPVPAVGISETGNSAGAETPVPGTAADDVTGSAANSGVRGDPDAALFRQLNRQLNELREQELVETRAGSGDPDAALYRRLNELREQELVETRAGSGDATASGAQHGAEHSEEVGSSSGVAHAYEGASSDLTASGVDAAELARRVAVRDEARAELAASLGVSPQEVRWWGRRVLEEAIGKGDAMLGALGDEGWTRLDPAARERALDDAVPRTVDWARKIAEDYRDTASVQRWLADNGRAGHPTDTAGGTGWPAVRRAAEAEGAAPVVRLLDQLDRYASADVQVGAADRRAADGTWEPTHPRYTMAGSETGAGLVGSAHPTAEALPTAAAREGAAVGEPSGEAVLGRPRADTDGAAPAAGEYAVSGVDRHPSLEGAIREYGARAGADAVAGVRASDFKVLQRESARADTELAKWLGLSDTEFHSMSPSRLRSAIECWVERAEQSPHVAEQARAHVGGLIGDEVRRTIAADQRSGRFLAAGELREAQVVSGDLRDRLRQWVGADAAILEGWTDVHATFDRLLKSPQLVLRLGAEEGYANPEIALDHVRALHERDLAETTGGDGSALTPAAADALAAAGLRPSVSPESVPVGGSHDGSASVPSPSPATPGGVKSAGAQPYSGSQPRSSRPSDSSNMGSPEAVHERDGAGVRQPPVDPVREATLERFRVLRERDLADNGPALSPEARDALVAAGLRPSALSESASAYGPDESAASARSTTPATLGGPESDGTNPYSATYAGLSESSDRGPARVAVAERDAGIQSTPVDPVREAALQRFRVLREQDLAETEQARGADAAAPSSEGEQAQDTGSAATGSAEHADTGGLNGPVGRETVAFAGDSGAHLGAASVNHPAESPLERPSQPTASEAWVSPLVPGAAMLGLAATVPTGADAADVVAPEEDSDARSIGVPGHAAASQEPGGALSPGVTPEGDALDLRRQHADATADAAELLGVAPQELRLWGRRLLEQVIDRFEAGLASLADRGWGRLDAAMRSALLADLGEMFGRELRDQAAIHRTAASVLDWLRDAGLEPDGTASRTGHRLSVLRRLAEEFPSSPVDRLAKALERFMTTDAQLEVMPPIPDGTDRSSATDAHDTEATPVAAPAVSRPRRTFGESWWFSSPLRPEWIQLGLRRGDLARKLDREYDIEIDHWALGPDSPELAQLHSEISTATEELARLLGVQPAELNTRRIERILEQATAGPAAEPAVEAGVESDDAEHLIDVARLCLLLTALRETAVSFHRVFAEATAVAAARGNSGQNWLSRLTQLSRRQQMLQAIPRGRARVPGISSRYPVERRPRAALDPRLPEFPREATISAREMQDIGVPPHSLPVGMWRRPGTRPTGAAVTRSVSDRPLLPVAGADAPSEGNSDFRSSDSPRVPRPIDCAPLVAGYAVEETESAALARNLAAAPLTPDPQFRGTPIEQLHFVLLGKPWEPIATWEQLADRLHGMEPGTAAYVVTESDHARAKSGQGHARLLFHDKAQPGVIKWRDPLVDSGAKKLFEAGKLPNNLRIYAIVIKFKEGEEELQPSIGTAWTGITFALPHAPMLPVAGADESNSTGPDDNESPPDAPSRSAQTGLPLDAYRDASSHAADMREKYRDFRWQLVVRPGGQQWDPDTIADTLAAQLPESDRPGTSQDVIDAVLRVAELAQPLEGGDPAIVVTSSQDADGRRRLHVQLDYTRPQAADPGFGVTKEELRQALSDMDCRIDVDTTDSGVGAIPSPTPWSQRKKKAPWTGLIGNRPPDGGAESSLDSGAASSVPDIGDLDRARSSARQELARYGDARLGESDSTEQHDDYLATQPARQDGPGSRPSGFTPEPVGFKEGKEELQPSTGTPWTGITFAPPRAPMLPVAGATDDVRVVNEAVRAGQGALRGEHFPVPGLRITSNDPGRSAALRMFSLWQAYVANRGLGKLVSRWGSAVTSAARRRVLAELYFWMSHQRYMRQVWAVERDPSVVGEYGESHPDYFRTRLGDDAANTDVVGRWTGLRAEVHRDPRTGRWHGGIGTQAFWTTVAIGRLVRARMDKEAPGGEVLQNIVELPGGIRVNGNVLYALEHDRFVIETARPDDQRTIFDAAIAELAAALDQRSVELSVDALRRFANAVYLLFQAPLMTRGSDATIRTFAATAFTVAFGRPVHLPHDIDLQAMSRRQSDFVEWFAAALGRSLYRAGQSDAAGRPGARTAVEGDRPLGLIGSRPWEQSDPSFDDREPADPTASEQNRPMPWSKAKAEPDQPPIPSVSRGDSAPGEGTTSPGGFIGSRPLEPGELSSEPAPEGTPRSRLSDSDAHDGVGGDGEADEMVASADLSPLYDAANPAMRAERSMPDPVHAAREELAQWAARPKEPERNRPARKEPRSTPWSRTHNQRKALGSGDRPSAGDGRVADRETSPLSSTAGANTALPLTSDQRIEPGAPLVDLQQNRIPELADGSGGRGLLRGQTNRPSTVGRSDSSVEVTDEKRRATPNDSTTDRIGSSPVLGRDFPKPGLVTNSNNPARTAGLRMYSLWQAHIANRGLGKLDSRWISAATPAARRRALFELYGWVSHQRHLRQVWARDRAHGLDEPDVHPAVARTHERLAPKVTHPDNFAKRLVLSRPNLDMFGIRGRERDGSQFDRETGRWEGGAETPAFLTFYDTGERIRARMAADSPHSEVLQNIVELPDGTRVNGNKLVVGAAAEKLSAIKQRTERGRVDPFDRNAEKFVTVTAEPDDQRRIFEAAIAEMHALVEQRAESPEPAVEDVRRFANAVYLLFQAPLIHRGSDSTIRTFMAILHTFAFGKPPYIPHDVDVQAYSRSQSDFVEWLTEQFAEDQRTHDVTVCFQRGLNRVHQITGAPVRAWKPAEITDRGALPLPAQRAAGGVFCEVASWGLLEQQLSTDPPGTTYLVVHWSPSDLAAAPIDFVDTRSGHTLVMSRGHRANELEFYDTSDYRGYGYFRGQRQVEAAIPAESDRLVAIKYDPSGTVVPLNGPPVLPPFPIADTDNTSDRKSDATPWSRRQDGSTPDRTPSSGWPDPTPVAASAELPPGGEGADGPSRAASAVQRFDEPFHAPDPNVTWIEPSAPLVDLLQSVVGIVEDLVAAPISVIDDNLSQVGGAQQASVGHAVVQIGDTSATKVVVVELDPAAGWFELSEQARTMAALFNTERARDPNTAVAVAVAFDTQPARARAARLLTAADRLVERIESWQIARAFDPALGWETIEFAPIGSEAGVVVELARLRLSASGLVEWRDLGESAAPLGHEDQEHLADLETLLGELARLEPIRSENELLSDGLSSILAQSETLDAQAAMRAFADRYDHEFTHADLDLARTRLGEAEAQIAALWSELRAMAGPRRWRSVSAEQPSDDLLTESSPAALEVTDRRGSRTTDSYGFDGNATHVGGSDGQIRLRESDFRLPIAGVDPPSPGEPKARSDQAVGQSPGEPGSGEAEPEPDGHSRGAAERDTGAAVPASPDPVGPVVDAATPDWRRALEIARGLASRWGAPADGGGTSERPMRPEQEGGGGDPPSYDNNSPDELLREEPPFPVVDYQRLRHSISPEPEEDMLRRALDGIGRALDRLDDRVEPAQRSMQLERAQRVAEVEYSRLRRRRDEIVTGLGSESTAELSPQQRAEMAAIDEAQQRYERLRALRRDHLAAVVDHACRVGRADGSAEAARGAELGRQLDAALAELGIRPEEVESQRDDRAAAAIRTFVDLVDSDTFRHQGLDESDNMWKWNFAPDAGGRLVPYPNQDFIVRDLIVRGSGATAMVSSDGPKYVLTNREGTIILIDRTEGVVRAVAPERAVSVPHPRFRVGIEALVFDPDGPAHPLDAEWPVVPLYEKKWRVREEQAERLYDVTGEQLRRERRMDAEVERMHGLVAERVRAVTAHYVVTANYRELVHKLGIYGANVDTTLGLPQLTRLRELARGGQWEGLLTELTEHADRLVELDAELRRLDQEIADGVALLPPTGTSNPRIFHEICCSPLAVMAVKALTGSSDIRQIGWKVTLSPGTPRYATAAALGGQPRKFVGGNDQVVQVLTSLGHGATMFVAAGHADTVKHAYAVTNYYGRIVSIDSAGAVVMDVTPNYYSIADNVEATVFLVGGAAMHPLAEGTRADLQRLIEQQYRLGEEVLYDADFKRRRLAVGLVTDAPENLSFQEFSSWDNVAETIARLREQTTDAQRLAAIAELEEAAEKYLDGWEPFVRIEGEANDLLTGRGNLNVVEYTDTVDTPSMLLEPELQEGEFQSGQEDPEPTDTAVIPEGDGSSEHADQGDDPESPAGAGEPAAITSSEESSPAAVELADRSGSRTTDSYGFDGNATHVGGSDGEIRPRESDFGAGRSRPRAEEDSAAGAVPLPGRGDSPDGGAPSGWFRPDRGGSALARLRDDAVPERDRALERFRDLGREFGVDPARPLTVEVERLQLLRQHAVVEFGRSLTRNPEAEAELTPRQIRDLARRLSENGGSVLSQLGGDPEELPELIEQAGVLQRHDETIEQAGTVISLNSRIEGVGALNAALDAAEREYATTKEHLDEVTESSAEKRPGETSRVGTTPEALNWLRERHKQARQRIEQLTALADSLEEQAHNAEDEQALDRRLAEIPAIVLRVGDVTLGPALASIRRQAEAAKWQPVVTFIDSVEAALYGAYAKFRHDHGSAAQLQHMMEQSTYLDTIASRVSLLEQFLPTIEASRRTLPVSAGRYAPRVLSESLREVRVFTIIRRGQVSDAASDRLRLLETLESALRKADSQCTVLRDRLAGSSFGGGVTIKEYRRWAAWRRRLLDRIDELEFPAQEFRRAIEYHNSVPVHAKSASDLASAAGRFDAALDRPLPPPPFEGVARSWEFDPERNYRSVDLEDEGEHGVIRTLDTLRDRARAQRDELVAVPNRRPDDLAVLETQIRHLDEWKTALQQMYSSRREIGEQLANAPCHTVEELSRFSELAAEHKQWTDVCESSAEVFDRLDEFAHLRDDLAALCAEGVEPEDHDVFERQIAELDEHLESSITSSRPSATVSVKSGLVTNSPELLELDRQRQIIEAGLEKLDTRIERLRDELAPDDAGWQRLEQELTTLRTGHESLFHELNRITDRIVPLKSHDYAMSNRAAQAAKLGVPVDHVTSPARVARTVTRLRWVRTAAWLFTAGWARTPPQLRFLAQLAAHDREYRKQIDQFERSCQDANQVAWMRMEPASDVVALLAEIRDGDRAGGHTTLRVGDFGEECAQPQEVIYAADDSAQADITDLADVPDDTFDRVILYDERAATFIETPHLVAGDYHRILKSDGRLQARLTTAEADADVGGQPHTCARIVDGLCAAGFGQIDIAYKQGGGLQWDISAKRTSESSEVTVRLAPFNATLDGRFPVGGTVETIRTLTHDWPDRDRIDAADRRIRDAFATAEIGECRRLEATIEVTDAPGHRKIGVTVAAMGVSEPIIYAKFDEFDSPGIDPPQCGTADAADPDPEKEADGARPISGAESARNPGIISGGVETGPGAPFASLSDADMHAAAPIRFPLPELRAPTSQERWHAQADVAESGLPDPVIFHSPELDAIGHVKLYIPLENRHPGSRSIKDRAARIVVGNMSDLPPGVPIIIASSGNHAIAYAEACRRRGIPVIAVVPENAPALKVAKLKERGATVIRHGANYNDAYEHAKLLARDHGGRFMDLSTHDSVAALGTAVHDMLSRRPSADVVVLPAGGGTVASAARVVRDFQQIWRPDREYKVLIACPENAPTVYESYKAGRVLTITPHTMADATNVSTVDAHLLPEIMGCADDVVLVPEKWIEQGIPLLSNAIGHPVEGAGVLAPMAVLGSGGVLHGASGTVHDIRGQEVLALVTGGNIAPDILDSIPIDNNFFRL
ncbi:pyridoxal-phosphate dependent enzyme [Nocardia sp. CA-084685]|uniref:pyridoxal-phosphate dependent enzyme n=1 Tax=Nocardia sp. CA-084685 TaxID=3239970 RepID=UPI003D96A297